ncbi:hypothetical protein ACTFIW_009287 [Dictyostelium discoideum]
MTLFNSISSISNSTGISKHSLIGNVVSNTSRSGGNSVSWLGGFYGCGGCGGGCGGFGGCGGGCGSSNLNIINVDIDIGRRHRRCYSISSISNSTGISKESLIGNVYSNRIATGDNSISWLGGFDGCGGCGGFGGCGGGFGSSNLNIINVDIDIGRRRRRYSISSISNSTGISKHSLIGNVESNASTSGSNSVSWLGGFDGCGGCGGCGGFGGCGGCGNSNSNLNIINVDIDIGRRRRRCC